jgi:3-(3-hydroxy-phenyl)propionate hydroxylase
VTGLRDVANLCWKLAWVVKGLVDARVLASYDTERRPHAKAMINFARLVGMVVTPSNVWATVVVHGTMWLLRRVPPLRRSFEELQIKPENRFKRGLFIPCRRRGMLVRGTVFPQSWLRRHPTAAMQLSDHVLGDAFCIIGFGIDPIRHAASQLVGLWRAVNGAVITLTQRGQNGGTQLSEAWEDMTGALYPETATYGWVVIVRPDRTIVHDGPAAQIDVMILDTLSLMGITQRPSTMSHPGSPAATA